MTLNIIIHFLKQFGKNVDNTHQNAHIFIAISHLAMKLNFNLIMKNKLLIIINVFFNLSYGMVASGSSVSLAPFRKSYA